MLKDIINNDLLNVFFNSKDFAEMHSINGRSIEVIIDNDRLKERSKKEYDGIHIGEILFFVPVEKMSITLRQDMPLIFDGRQMFIFSIREDMGMYEIILNYNSGG